MKYAVIACADPAQLVRWVNEALRAGWQLQGGVCVAQSDAASERDGYAVDNFNRVFCQAVIGAERFPDPVGSISP